MALSTAEHDLPVQTKTCRRIGAVVTGARASSVFWSVIKPLSLIRISILVCAKMVTHQALAISLYYIPVLMQFWNERNQEQHFLGNISLQNRER